MCWVWPESCFLNFFSLWNNLCLEEIIQEWSNFNSWQPVGQGFVNQKLQQDHHASWTFFCACNCSLNVFVLLKFITVWVKVPYQAEDHSVCLTFPPGNYHVPLLFCHPVIQKYQPYQHRAATLLFCISSLFLPLFALSSLSSYNTPRAACVGLQDFLSDNEWQVQRLSLSVVLLRFMNTHLCLQWALLMAHCLSSSLNCSAASYVSVEAA